MKITFGNILAPLAVLLLAATTLAAELPEEKINVSKLTQAGTGATYVAAAPAGEDRQLAAQKTDFMKFAAAKIREMNHNHILSRERMQITRRPNGLYQALFHEIDDASLSYQVNRSPSGPIPYVAVLSYQEQVLTASCTTPDDCRRGPFTPVEIIPNRHIFVYNNGAWQ